MDLAALENLLKEKSYPPVEQWHPDHCGDIDIRIDRDGQWYHEGRPINRKPLVRLFSSVLLREESEYFLITPVEKMRIHVDAEPYCLVDANRVEDAWVFVDQLGDSVILDEQHPLNYQETEQGEPYPTLLLRKNLSGLIHRNLFYRLLEQADVNEVDGKQVWVLTSRGRTYRLAETH